MLDHRRRQPIRPILTNLVRLFVSGNAGVGQQQLCPVLRSYGCHNLQASLDGFLIVSHGDPTTEFFICNPVTRKCAPLGKPQSHQGFHNYIAGFYLHQPSGEYRVLWGSQARSYDAEDTNCRTFYYVIAVGSNDTRCVAEGCIPQPTASSPSLDLALRGGLESSYRIPPVHHRGSLHWRLGKYHGCDASYIMVFNTAAETFRLICQPAQLSPLNLLFLEMDGSLALCSFSNDKDTIDVWVVQDYDTGTWSFKHRINLSGVDPILPSDIKLTICPRMVVLNEGELLIQFAPRRVLRYDMAGKFLGYVKEEGSQEVNLWITKHYLQESVIPLPLLLEVREEDEPPFFTGL
jgi:F-box interacting protein